MTDLISNQLASVSLTPNGGNTTYVRKQRSQRFSVPTTTTNFNLPPSSAFPTPLSTPFQSNLPPPTQLLPDTNSNRFYTPIERAGSSDSRGSDDSGSFGMHQHYPSPPIHQSHSPIYQPQMIHSHSPHQGFHNGNGNGNYLSNFHDPPLPRRPDSNQGMRGAMPSEWMGQRGPNGNSMDYAIAHQAIMNQGYAALNGRVIEDDIIPTAIVIKNIPFTVSKEMLLGVMEDLRLPPPFAFNYHFENSQFRGLAFANFRSASDAALTVSALNGFDLQGRKLRTEFKKVLKEGEKERIERDKALRRMRSQRELVISSAELAGIGPGPGGWDRRENLSANMNFGSNNFVLPEEEDYGQQITNGAYTNTFVSDGAFSNGSLGNGTNFGGVRRQMSSSRDYIPSAVEVSFSSTAEIYGDDAASEGSLDSKHELDLNDPRTLEIFSRVLIFKDDGLRDELAFARSLSTMERTVVHLVAAKLGVVSKSVGSGEDRCVVVYKLAESQSSNFDSSRTLRHSSSTVSRGSNASLAQQSNVAFLTPSLGLRAKKSMPEIRHSNFVSENFTSRLNNNGRRSNLNLREGYATVGTGSRRMVNSSTGLMGLFQAGAALAEDSASITSPTSGTTSNSSNLSATSSWASEALRQPKGPSLEGFSIRTEAEE